VRRPAPGTSGLRLEPARALDLSRPVAHVRLDRVRVRWHAVLPGIDAELVLDLAAMLAAADAAGVASWCVRTAAEYVRVREQFGKPIGAFQAVKHLCAEMLVQQPAMAVARGVADVVVAYRAFNERSGHRFGQVSTAAAQQVNSSGVDNSFHYPMGIATPAATVAMLARRYLHDYGATSADFGRIAVVDRVHAATNPNAWFYGRPITLEEHQGRQAGIGPSDVHVTVLYDHFTPYVLMQLEELGFCGRGEAKDFITGGRLELAGELPLNPHGGQLGEAYIHGMNGIAEGVRQVRGTAANQVADVHRSTDEWPRAEQ
jgi:acetyl-CoA acetyltransferase